MPLVTIVMPAYNVEHYIAKSIESVIAQTEQDWELLIINDGSTDNTLDVITPYVNKDCRIRVINQKNAGVSAARNKGLELALGEYISFLDADDIYDNRYVELMVEALRSRSADISFSKYKEINGSQVISESPDDINQLVGDAFIHHIIGVKNTHANMAMMYRLKYLRSLDICFLEGCANGEDRIFVLQSTYFTNVIFVPYYLYNYIYREDSACRAEVSYDHFLAKLDGYLNLMCFFENLPIKNKDHLHYLNYIDTEILGIKNNLRRKLWSDLKSKKFQEVSLMLDLYYYRYNEPFNVPQTGIRRFTVCLKMKIICSPYKWLWRIIFR